MNNNIQNEELNNIQNADAQAEQSAPEVTEAPQKPSLPPHKEYAKRMRKYKSKYTFILSVAEILVGAAIGVAIFLDLMIGIAIAVFAVLFYVRFASNEMYATLK